MAATKNTPKNDRALRFYNQVLGLDHLHYGIWEQDDALTIDNLKKAQQRYEDMVINTIPSGTKTVLDVGCGTGELSKRLKSLGYQVEGLSPDINQKDLYKTKTGNQPFHFCRFEEFIPDKQYDCIIMSESGQYIPLNDLFSTAAKCLRPGGHLINIDYFVLDNAKGKISKSGHNLNSYEKKAASNDFIIIATEDITDSILKTLDLSKQLVERGLIAVEILTEKFRYKHPIATKIFNWFTRNKKNKFIESLIVLDSEKFKAAKKYRLYHFKNAE